MVWETAFDLASIAFDLYQLTTGGWERAGENLAYLGLDIIGAAIPFVPGLGVVARSGKMAARTNDAMPFLMGGRFLGAHAETRLASRGTAYQSHHIIQHAAVLHLPGYDYFAAPAIQLEGLAKVAGTAHSAASTVQDSLRFGGGTYAAERRVAYRGLRAAGLSRQEARSAIHYADDYFIGVLRIDLDTPTRIPLSRK